MVKQDTEFRYNKPVTRLEAIVMLLNDQGLNEEFIIIGYQKTMRLC
jgi:exonuclease VII small subunit